VSRIRAARKNPLLETPGVARPQRDWPGGKRSRFVAPAATV